MAKPILLTGRTEILAAIYNPNNLPSAVIELSPKSNDRPYCVHSFRNDDLSFFDEAMKRAKGYQNLAVEKPETDEQIQAYLYPFFEDYPNQTHTCNGCYYSDKVDDGHKVRDSKDACTKSTDACA